MLLKMAMSLLLATFVTFSGTALAQPREDGTIYLNESDIPADLKDAPEDNMSGTTERGRRFYLERSLAPTRTIYERTLARWKDPFTPPQSRAECVKWATGPGFKICIGWKVQWKWMYTTAYTRVSTADPEDIPRAINECLVTAAVAGALAAVVSGGSAAIPTFEGVLKGCLVVKLKSLVSVATWTSSGWGDWE